MSAMDRKRGLGRGLDALFGDEEKFTQGSVTVPPASNEGNGNGPRRTVGIDQLQPGTFQPRQSIDQKSLEDLASSIAVHGVLQPILVRPISEDRFEIIAGERRWRAAQMARLHEVPVIIKTLTDTQALEIALIENLQREDLNAIEEAQGIQRLSDEFGHTQEQLAKALGKSRPAIANALRLLTLPASVQDLLRQGKLTAGHARALVGAPDAEALARQIVDGDMSVRDVERLMKKPNGGSASPKGFATKDVDTLALEKEISERLGLSVIIDAKADGKAGTVRINYKSLDQLDGLLKRLS